MLSHPALFPALIGSDTQSEALLAEQNVSAVSGVDRDYCVILRELADVALLGIDIAGSMQSAYPVVRVAKNVKDLGADAGHDSHVENNIL